MVNSDRLIIYKNPETGYLCTMCPSDNCTKTVEEIAQKDVPKGVKYRIINRSDLNADYDFRDAWDVDDSELTDGEGTWE